jgi:hypothetical protein
MEDRVAIASGPHPFVECTRLSCRTEGPHCDYCTEDPFTDKHLAEYGEGMW